MKNRITCYTPGQKLPGLCFFILSKGLNAGKPLNSPCPNCFAFTCYDEAELDRYYWLCYGMWQSGHFRALLVGSVIPFLRKPELVAAIEQTDSIARFEGEQFWKQIRLLSEFNEMSNRVKTHLKELELLKRFAVAKMISR